MSRHITLLLPGLLDGAVMTGSGLYPDGDPGGDQNGSDIEALEWLLTLARPQTQPQTDISSLLWQQASQAGSLPSAALSYRFDFGEMPPGPVLRADPVYLEADRDCVRLLSADLADLELAQARQLIDEINTQFSDEPWMLVPGTARRWYLLLDDEAAIVTHSPAAVLGDNIHDFMPGGEGQRYWRSIVNEIQMLMFSSPVNQRRQADGRVPASSLWLWGEGAAPPVLSLPWVGVYGDEAVVGGMGLQAGLPVAPVPATAQRLLAMAPPAGQILCQPALTAGWPGLLAFNHDWALPLYKALQRGSGFRSRPQLDSLEILTGNGVSYALSAGKRRWWQRRQRIDSFMD